mmetsp:Transcript_53349/g.147796  ORF Transcript_53349/g.147796 Transcript_53349/m.147796 type:complete len:210 (-) Transcript_53349:344-973(-)
MIMLCLCLGLGIHDLSLALSMHVHLHIHLSLHLSLRLPTDKGQVGLMRRGWRAGRPAEGWRHHWPAGERLRGRCHDRHSARGSSSNKVRSSPAVVGERLVLLDLGNVVRNLNLGRPVGVVERRHPHLERLVHTLDLRAVVARAQPLEALPHSYRPPRHRPLLGFELALGSPLLLLPKLIRLHRRRPSIPQPLSLHALPIQIVPAPAVLE